MKPAPRTSKGRNDTERTGAKSEGVINKIAVAVIITLVAGGTAPWWWGMLFPKPAPRVIPPECTPEFVKSQLFRSGPAKSAAIRATAATMKQKFSIQDLQCVSDLATILLEQDPENGHGLYFMGETWRLKAAEGPAHAVLCRQRMREYFFRYLSHEPRLALSERDGDGNRCYERELGYCAERTAWISHLMAIDDYLQARETTDTATRRERLESGAKFLKADLDFGGFEQIMPSSVLRDKISRELRDQP